MNSIPGLNGFIDPVAPVSQEDFREGMAKMGAAVSIITTDGPAGRAGFAATAVCSVTDSPATLLFCLNRSASVFNAVTTNGFVCINILASHHEALSNLFGGKTPVDERFAAAEWTCGRTGTPILKDALVAFECRISAQFDIGTHRVLYCAVEAIHGGNSAEALLYYRRAYRRLANG